MEGLNDCLPQNFLDSLRVLFDILDEGKKGCVHLRDIETRWNDRGVNGLPPGVLHALKNVAPSNGFLTFELFVSGLKLALVSNAQKLRSATHREVMERRIRDPIYSKPRVPVTAAVRPNNVLERPVSSVSRSKSCHYTNTRPTSHYGSSTIRETVPSRPQRPTFLSNTVPEIPERDIRCNSLLSELKSWHKQQDLSQTKSEPIYVNVNRHQKMQVVNRTQVVNNTQVVNRTQAVNNTQAVNRTQAGNNTQAVNRTQAGNNTHVVNRQAVNRAQAGNRTQTAHSQRTSPKEMSRRHTLTTGINLDHALNIRLKQLGEEKTILLQGQHVVDETKDWYKKKLEQVNVKEKYARHYLFNSNSLVSHREQMNYQRTRIGEVNHHLKNLIDDNSKGFPHHMNLSFRESSSSNQQLKRQNHVLTKEVQDKDSKISQLESEKRKLIRELFERKSEGELGDGDVTFV